MIHSELSKQVIGAAMNVLNSLKPGLDEKIYENALVVEFEWRGLRVAQQSPFPVIYRDRPVGRLIPDLIVEEKIIVDTKVVAAFNETHSAQMLGYLSITGLELAILLNFKYAKLEWKRIAKSRLLPE